MSDRNWSLDRKIPLGLIAVIIVQSLGAAWWASAIQSGQAEARKEREKFDERLLRMELSRDDIAARLIRVEEKITGTNATLEEILRAIRRMDGNEGQRR